MRQWICRRNALIFCVSASIFISGCTAVKQDSGLTPKLDASFDVQAEMEYGDGQTAALLLSRCSNALWEATFSEPAALAGVVLTFDGDAVSASYKGLSFTVPKSALPAKNMLLYVTEALDSAAESPELVCSGQQDGTWSYSAECEGGSYSLTFDADGQLMQFDLPAQPLHLSFSEYTVRTDAAETIAVTTAAESGTSAETTEATNTAGTETVTAETGAETA